MDQTLSIIFFFTAIFIFAGILFALVALTRRGSSGLDIEKYRTRWLSIEQQLRRDEVSSYQMCVLNADKLLDQALKDKGVKGETMAERMKQMKQTWSNANSVWSAHKLRNRIAHEDNVALDYEGTRRTLYSYKQALKDIGAI